MKLYHTLENSFWCCTGTGMENHVKYRDTIYFQDDDALYVNLFVPSAVEWKGKGATITQTTSFPQSSTTKLRWALKKPVYASLKLRHPHWSDRAIVLVNGVKAARSDVPRTYVELARSWRNGDQVELQLSMEMGVSSALAAPDIVAFTYGPLVLAGALGRDGLQLGSDIIVNERKYGEYNNAPFTAPMLAGETEQLPGTVRPGEHPLEFTIAAADGKPVRLFPYHNIAHERYATYWQVAATVT